MIFRWSTPVTFVKAVFRTVQFLWQGRPVLAPREVQEDRYSVCRKCPLQLDGQCTVCTCFVSVKVLLSSESCPDSPPRWKKLTFSKPNTTDVTVG
jgi:hypothetical protein